MAGSQSGQVICHSWEFAAFIGVGEELCIALRVTEGPAKLGVVVRDEVFGVLVQVRGWGVGSLGLFFSLPGGGGRAGGWG